MATPCVFVDQGLLGPFDMVNTYACDPWAVPHVVAPFLVGIITKDPLFAWFMAYFAETIEIIMYQWLGGYEFFIGDADGNENLAGALVDDAFIQGGIGALLSLIFLFVFAYPRLLAWKDAWRGHAGRFWFYALFLIFLVLPAVQYQVVVGEDDFQLGVLLMPFITIIVIAIFVAIQDACTKPRKKKKINRLTRQITIYTGSSFQSPWKEVGYTVAQQREYWITASVFILVIYLQELIPSWLYSSAVQTWLVSGVFAIYLFLRKKTLKGPSGVKAPSLGRAKGQGVIVKQPMFKRDSDWIFIPK